MPKRARDDENVVGTTARRVASRPREETGPRIPPWTRATALAGGGAGPRRAPGSARARVDGDFTEGAEI
eukprot:31365-Pelagococcus_subviridis.AAC.28